MDLIGRPPAPWMVVSTIAALRLVSAPTIVTTLDILVEGYASSGDQGGGTFYWDNTSAVADNGGTVIRPSTAPATGRWIRSIIDDYNPAWFGAKGDGSTDDSTALNALFALGNKVYDGRGKTYAYTGNFTPASSMEIRNMTWKQMAPGAGTVRTIFGNTTADLTLRNVKVLRNGTTTQGVVGNDAGMWFTACDNLRMYECEVSGDGPGFGMHIVNCTKPYLEKCYVHDMRWTAGADPGTEQIVGIYFNGSSDCWAVNCLAKNLDGKIGAAAVRAYQTDGIDFSGCDTFHVIGCQSENTGEGFDTTGSVGNKNFSFVACMATDIDSFGFKFANSAYDGTLSSCVAERCGYSGFVCGGAAAAGLPNERNIIFTGCIALDTASNGNWAAFNNAGFRIEQGAFDTYLPDGIRFIGCQAIDRQAVKTMKYGFINQPPYTSGSTLVTNRCIQCSASGFTVSAFKDFLAPTCKITKNAVQSIPNTTQTAIDYQTETYDPSGMHSTVSNINLVFINDPGTYVITSNVEWPTSATANALISSKILVNGTEVAEVRGILNSVVGIVQQCTITYPLVVGDSVRVEVTQSSGGAISVQTAKTFFQLAQCCEMTS